MRFPAHPPAFDIASLDGETLRLVLTHASGAPTLRDGRYLHWDQLRRRPPPAGLNHEHWWYAQKIARLTARVLVPGLRDERGQPFSYCRLDAIDKATHQLDRRDAAKAVLETMGDEGARQQYRIDQLIEEAISSSLIEGAKLTTRAQAKSMIREGREPSSRGEKMVLNNYMAMTRLLELSGRDLSVDDLLEIHATLGADALDSPGAEGRLRTESDNVRVEDSATGEVWFVPARSSCILARLPTPVRRWQRAHGESAFLLADAARGVRLRPVPLDLRPHRSIPPRVLLGFRPH